MEILVHTKGLGDVLVRVHHAGERDKWVQGVPEERQDLFVSDGSGVLNLLTGRGEFR